MRELQLIRTDSPRTTLTSFQQLRDRLEEAFLAYHKDQTIANSRRLSTVILQLTQLFDLSSLPEASRQKKAVEVFTLLLDIFGRIELPPLDSVPDGTGEEGAPRKWLITGTPIAIIHIEDGLREGVFLFGREHPRSRPSSSRESSICRFDPRWG